MEIKQINSDKKGFFTAEENGIEAGRMSYTWVGSHKLIIDHTEVNPDFSGKNIGKSILMTLVRYARDNHIKIIPLCPFAKSVFDKDQTLRDVLL